MNQMLTRLVVLVALGCKSSTGPAGFTLHAEVVNKTTFPNYWANTPFSWQYLNAQDIILDHGTITIQSDSACLTPPVAPPTTTRDRSEEHTSELQSLRQLVCRLLLENKNSIHAHARVDARPPPRA